MQNCSELHPACIYETDNFSKRSEAWVSCAEAMQRRLSSRHSAIDLTRTVAITLSVPVKVQVKLTVGNCALIV